MVWTPRDCDKCQATAHRGAKSTSPVERLAATLSVTRYARHRGDLRVCRQVSLHVTFVPEKIIFQRRRVMNNTLYQWRTQGHVMFLGVSTKYQEQKRILLPDLRSITNTHNGHRVPILIDFIM